MRIVLSDKLLNSEIFPSDVKIITVELKDIKKYDNNSDVIAIACSRAIAKEVANYTFPSLKLIQLTSAGFDGVPLELYREKEVNVANAGSVYSIPIAETVVLGILLMVKRLHKNPNNRHVKFARHYDTTISELASKHILILGAGNIGTAIASRLLGFDVVIDGYDKYLINKPEYSRIITDKEELFDELDKYDYVISTLPDLIETRGFIDKDFISRMSPNAVFINVGRKTVFVEDDLYRALKKGVINGAVLDMFEKVPNPILNKFRRLSNVIVLPGVSAISKEVNIRLRNHMSENILSSLNDQPIKNIVN